jgi:hypothetical protein
MAQASANNDDGQSVPFIIVIREPKSQIRRLFRVADALNSQSEMLARFHRLTLSDLLFIDVKLQRI